VTLNLFSDTWSVTASPVLTHVDPNYNGYGDPHVLGDRMLFDRVNDGNMTASIELARPLIAPV
jgi:hypothetical protein